MLLTKKILVCVKDIGLVAFLQNRIKDRRFQFVLATSYEQVNEMLENEDFFAAVIDYDITSSKNERVIEYVLKQKIPTIATVNSLTKEVHQNLRKYPIIDYVIGDNFAGKGYLSDLLRGLEYFNKRKVLIAYDNESNEKLNDIKKIFESLMFLPICTTTINESLEIINNDDSIKIVYINEKLKDGEGLNLAREIKQIYAKRDVIVFAGYDNEMHKNGDLEKLKGEFLKSGVTDFLTFPIDKERFNTHILGTMRILKQKKQLDTYVETVDKYVLISITNLKGIIVYASDAFCNISGYTKEELIGRSHNIIRHPEMPADIYKSMWETIKSGETWKGEIKNRKKDGDFYWVSVQIEPIYDDVGEVMGYQSVRFDITDRKRIEELSMIDQLTSLFNRRKFDEVIKYEYRRWQRAKEDFSLIICDLDHFKMVNDIHGHLVGDIVLKECSKILKENVRSCDSVFRWGGEEFVILSPITNKEGALILGEKIRKSIEKHTFDVVGNKTISIGITTIQAEDKIDDIIDRADKALYISKEKGRNKVEFL